ncbi:MAG TPA: hypothetical protein VLN58_06180, partial [Verrucomicrobiae bacterium]|nr:hypothetical protein [Verrucomicrobiae bacterium]
MPRLKVAFDPWVLAPRFRHQGTNVYGWRLLDEFRKAAGQMPEIEFSIFNSNGSGAACREERENFSFVSNRLVHHERLWRLGGAS